MSILQLFYRVTVVALAFSSLSSALDECFGGLDHDSYLNWVAENGSQYTSSVCYKSLSSDRTNGIALHWKLDDENVYIAVAARAIGWVGFGLAEVGGMKGADMVLFESANPGQLRDAHVLDELLPITDDCQDWVFVNSQTEGGFIIFEGYRKLQTVDTQDRDVSYDIDPFITAQRIVAAWGDSTTASYHGLNRAIGSLRWYGGDDEFEIVNKRLEMMADGYVDIVAPNHTIEAIETSYVDFCYSWDHDVIVQGVPPNRSVTAIAVVVILPEESRPFVHHAVAYGSAKVANQSECLPQIEYNFPLYSWAPGVHPFVPPNNVGIIMGPGYGMQSFRIQVHYNNPELIENVVDNGGLRVYYTLAPREHELGVFLLGDPFFVLDGKPIASGVSQYKFSCSSACSKFALTEPVTVIRESFHMHRGGYAASSYHIRDDKVIRESHVDFFDFDQNGSPSVRLEPFMINPGDSFTSSFYFNSKNGTKFGKSSFEEMSFHIILYYPAVRLLDSYPWLCTNGLPIPVCNSTVESRFLAPNDPVERLFGQASRLCSDDTFVNKSFNDTSANKTTSDSTYIGASWLHFVGFWLLSRVLE